MTNFIITLQKKIKMKRFLNSILFSIVKNLAMNTDLACADNLSAEASPFPCGDVKYGYPIALFYAKPGTAITAVGAIPTVAEVTTALGLSTVAKLIALNPISDGSSTPEVMKIQGPDDLAEPVNVKMTIAGQLKYLNDTEIDKLRQIFAIQKRVQLWWVDNFGRWYGGKTGYRASLIVTPHPKKEFGNASKAGLDIAVEYYLNDTVAFATALDLGYLDLDNA